MFSILGPAATRRAADLNGSNPIASVLNDLRTMIDNSGIPKLKSALQAMTNGSRVMKSLGVVPVFHVMVLGLCNDIGEVDLHSFCFRTAIRIQNYTELLPIPGRYRFHCLHRFHCPVFSSCYFFLAPSLPPSKF